MNRAARRSWRIVAVALTVLAITAFSRPWTLLAQGPALSKVKFATLSESDAREWLTYLASDALQGRQVFTEGYGLAAAYIADRLKQFGVKPIGDAGYFQTVKLRSYKVTRNSSVLHPCKFLMTVTASLPSESAQARGPESQPR